jgi:PAS domain S-box-containing protein
MEARLIEPTPSTGQAVPSFGLLDRLLDSQGQILDLIAASVPFFETLERITLVIERLTAPSRCSILLLDRDGMRLRHGAAPSLPAEYIRALDGNVIGPAVGSCGTAAYRGEPVIVHDIASDPLWTEHRHLALAAGLRSCWALPIKNDAGRVLGSFAVYRAEPCSPTQHDWTVLQHMARLVGVALRQHEKEALLTESQARWRLAAEVARIGTFDVDFATGERVWSDLFKAIVGVPLDATPSRELFLTIVHPDDRAAVLDTYDGWYTPDSARPISMDYRITRPCDRGLRWVNVTGCTIRDEHGRPLRRIGTCIDITDRKSAEERLRASEANVRRMQDQLQWAQRVSSTGSAVRDLRTGHAEWSDEAYRILGIPPCDGGPTTEAFLALVHPEDRDEVAARVEKPPAPGLRRTTEFRFVRPDGEVRWVVWEAETLTDAGGEVAQRISVFRDVTDLRAAEAQRQEAERQLYHAQKIEALGTLAGGIAHDLNNTLVPIVALTKMAMRHAPPEKSVNRDLKIIHDAGLRARDLVGQILAFSRKEAGSKEAVDLAALVESSTKLLRASVPSTINIVHRLETPSTIWANPGQIHQVLTNLVMNAAQAISPHLGTVTIEVAPAPPRMLPSGDRPVIRLTVVDDGCGMDDATSRRIFEPFFTTKDVGQGTGLGLSVAHGIVTGHGGLIVVASRLGEGARFDLYFPARRNEAVV